MDNWVEKRWLRENNLKIGANRVWLDVTAAIDSACTSFKERYHDLAGVECTTQNGHRILVTISRPIAPTNVSVGVTEFPIQIIFEGNRITVVRGHNENSKHYSLEADETHAFLKVHGQEMSADEFSRVVLEDALFKVQEIRRSVGSVGVDHPWG